MHQLIVITDFDNVENEHFIINEMFRIGLCNLHLRKPNFSLEEIKNWIEKIEPTYRKYITVWHRHFSALQQYGVYNIHFPEQDRIALTKQTDFDTLKKQGVHQISTSIHQAKEYYNLDKAFDYTFISPMFNSISKQGYKAIDKDELTIVHSKKNTKIIALGGIDRSNCNTALNMGLDGVAVLGAIWKNSNPLNAFIEIKNELQ